MIKVLANSASGESLFPDSQGESIFLCPYIEKD